jgi:hypothetical protein
MNSLARQPGPFAAPVPDLEDRVRQLELWAVAAHAQIEAMQERSKALTPIVSKLSDAAEAQAAVAQANAVERAARRDKLDVSAKTVSLTLGSITLIMTLVGTVVTVVARHA